MRSLLFAAISGLLLAESLCAQDGTAKERAEIASLVEQVFKVASPDRGMGDEAQKLSEKFIKLDQRKVVEELLPLLESKKTGVAFLASYIIHECDDGAVVPGQLEALIKGYHNDGGWLPRAIASLRTEEAAEFLAREFRSNPHQGQLDSSLIWLGEKSVPFLLKGFEEADLEKEEKYLEELIRVFGEMKAKGSSALPRLLAVAESAKYDVERRKQAVLIIGAIGDAAESSFSRLIALSKHEPQFFADTVRQAIANSGSASAAPILADYVDQGNVDSIYYIAHLGPKGKSVGPRVAGWLDHEDWNARAVAVDAIAAIGYKEERQTLEKLLSSRTNWRVAYAAAQALATLGSKESIPALSAAANSHWFPFVREKAANAVKILEGEKPAPASGPHFGGGYYAEEGEAWTIASGKIPGLSSPQLREEEFSSFESRAPELAKKFLSRRDWNGEEHLRSFGGITSCPTKDGVLLGANAGEWVGGLAYIPNNGDVTMVLRENAAGIEKWQERILVAVGMYHLGMNNGLVHEVRITGGKVSVVPWFMLPGSPRAMWVSAKDQLVVECYGGTMVFSDPSTFEYHSAPRQKDN
ncbi:HEAT repeat domain-containing protein [Roseimicrobium sp. ORNL1]|uniref:HEAT repeat domain-containing protein n=1 Tax=Roseimicrobium sp. ORNL1 TaxID=2711231 RepID=UPI0013E1DC70|nr:HEAT repeat domain-containing protein [Roseimicrobium sp. ORNL1]QIF05708.1 hypothetical protein G5S37_30815 [Roseimicrobium sp. ORNL1]